MSTYFKIITLVILITLLAACSSAKESTTPVPQVVYVTVTPRLIEITATPRSTETIATPEPTALLPTPTSEPPVGTVLLIFGNRFIPEIYRTVRPAFEDAGYEVLVASRTMGVIRAKNADLEVEVDLLLEDVQVSEYDAILFNCDNDITFGSALVETDRIAQEAVAQGIVLAAICSGPRILAYAQVVEGKTVTGEPSQTCQMLEDEGGVCTGRNVERDGLLITARDRYASRGFAQTIIDALQEQAAKTTIEEGDDGIFFTDSGQRLGSAQSWEVALGDLDGDGDLDAFTANAVQGGAKNAVWMNDGQGSFTLNEQSIGYGQGLALGDLDGDGDLDVVVTNWWGEEHSAVWINDGSGIFMDSGQNLGFAFRPALGDLDGDGDLDILLAQEEANTVWLNDGGGVFSDTGQRLGEAITAAATLGDLDGDGDLDVLTGGWEEAAKVWLNDGAGTFTEHEQNLSPASVHIHDLALGDVDGDGYLDAFMAVASGHPNQVWLNDGTGAFSDSGQQLRSSLTHGIELGDLDGDGDLDAVTAHGEGGSSGGKIWLNDGTGQFNRSDLTLGDLYSSASVLGDLDDDGDLDIFIAHGDQSSESGGGIPNNIWLNETITSDAALPLTGSSGLIAFYSERDGNAEIYTMNPDGGDPRRLTFNHFHDVAPAWSPDSSEIAFLSNRDDPDPQGCFPECFYQLYIINPDGSGERKLVETEFSVHHPVWHPGGEKLSFDTEFGLEGDIYVVNADGSSLQLLIENGFWSDWSPDGSRIVFASNQGGDIDLYVANADGTNPRQLTDNPGMDVFPAWSPDGEKIAFVQVGSSFQNQDIFLINPDGSGQVQLTDERQNVDEDPAWSPYGGQIAFQSDRDGNFEIYIMNADGSDQQRLTNHRAGDYWPSWGSAANDKSSSINFEKSAQTFLSIPTWKIGLADLDEDGDLDAVFANSLTNASQVWLNDGDGVFADTSQQLGKYGHGVDVGDVDGDGDLDVVLTTHEFVPTRVYLNDGRAVFSELDKAFEVTTGHSVDLYDLDGDGDLDAVGEGSGRVGIYWNDGRGYFTNSGLNFPMTTAWGDLDSDGDVDVLIKENGVGYAVRLNDGTGNFIPHWEQTDTAAMHVGDMALGDVDNDGDLDAMITNGYHETTSHPAMVFLNDGDGRLTDSGQRLSAVTNAGASLGDLDNDGDLDLVLTNYMEPCQIWLNDGSGQFADSGFRFGNDQFYRHAHLGDLDGDGDLDILLAAFGLDQGPNEIWFNRTQ